MPRKSHANMLFPFTYMNMSAVYTQQSLSECRDQIERVYGKGHAYIKTSNRTNEAAARELMYRIYPDFYAGEDPRCPNVPYLAVRKGLALLACVVSNYIPKGASRKVLKKREQQLLVLNATPGSEAKLQQVIRNICTYRRGLARPCLPEIQMLEQGCLVRDTVPLSPREQMEVVEEIATNNAIREGSEGSRTPQNQGARALAALAAEVTAATDAAAVRTSAVQTNVPTKVTTGTQTDLGGPELDQIENILAFMERQRQKHEAEMIRQKQEQEATIKQLQAMLELATASVGKAEASGSPPAYESLASDSPPAYESLASASPPAYESLASSEASGEEASIASLAAKVAELELESSPRGPCPDPFSQIRAAGLEASAQGAGTLLSAANPSISPCPPTPTLNPCPPTAIGSPPPAMLPPPLPCPEAPSTSSQAKVIEMIKKCLLETQAGAGSKPEVSFSFMDSDPVSFVD